jgi:CHAT domain-containing protein
MKPTRLIVSVSSLISLLFILSCAVQQRRFDLSRGSTHAALSQGKIKEALDDYESQALEAERNAAASLFPQQYWESATRAYIEASRAAQFSGQYQKQVTYAGKSLEMAERAKDPVLRVYALIMLDWAYGNLRDFDRAVKFVEKGLEVVGDIPSNTPARINFEAELYRNFGNHQIRLRQYTQAIVMLTKALELNEHLLATQKKPNEGIRINFILTLQGLGRAYRRAGNLEKALEQYERVFNLAKEWKLKNDTLEVDLYQSVGEIQLQKKNYLEALEIFRKALAMAENQQRPRSVRSASASLGDILREIGKPGESIPYYQRAIEQIESTRALLESEEYRQSYFEGEVNVYQRMIRDLVASGRTEEAFNYSERARSRAFLDVLGTKVQLANVKSGLVRQELALQERVAGLKARLPSADENPGDLRRELRDAERAYDSFLAKVRKQNKEQTSLMAVEPLTLKQVQELLQPGITLVEYFVGQVSTRVWIIEKERMQYVGIRIGKQELAERVKTLRDTIFALGEKEKFNESSTFLYQELIQPILPHASGKELIIVPHDVLHYLPFHALRSPEGRYLIEQYPIYYLSSASLLQFVKEKKTAGGEKVLAFGNPDLGDPEKNLVYAELEAEEVKNVYPQSSVFLKKEASEEKSKSLSPTHDILHFATHAELNEDDPLSSAVLLAREDKEDGRLEVREIFGMDLKANLVVLSGCDTALGKLSTGDELVGLTRAFIYAGSPSVVASLWSVDDSSTAHLMASFYRNLKTMSKVEALRQAQLELIRGEGRSDMLARRGIGGIGKLGESVKSESPSQNPISISTSHPYFWAPFILVGDGN